MRRGGPRNVKDGECTEKRAAIIMADQKMFKRNHFLMLAVRGKYLALTCLESVRGHCIERNVSENTKVQ